MNNESADEPPLSDRIRSWARSKAHASAFNPFGTDDSQQLPRTSTSSAPVRNTTVTFTTSQPNIVNHGRNQNPQPTSGQIFAHDGVRSDTSGQPATSPVDTQREGEESATMTPDEAKPTRFQRFTFDAKRILLYNPWINWLLLFVPVGIALGALMKAKGDASPVSPSVVFAMNAIAIIPLAGLLAFATESVASKLGDTIGALMNVTFGNAVELIIFIIALVAKEIRIVQASLLGSILANLLLILGMCFLFGGLRFREQLYNSTVGQMSAGLLSLSVISLLLPTAFHYSFNDSSEAKADRVVLKVSRGTSVVLLLVYVLYLLFQLKSHAYMYESTPQHLIDEESHPGVLAEFLDHSSSSSGSDMTDDDSDTSSNSHTTAKRIRRAFRRRRKSSASSKETGSMPSMNRTPSSFTKTIDESAVSTPPIELGDIQPRLDPVLSGDEADVEGGTLRPRETSFGVTSRDFQPEKASTASIESPEKKRKHRRHKRNKHSKRAKENAVEHDVEKTANAQEEEHREEPRVGFVNAPLQEPTQADSTRKPFALRSLPRPALPKVLSNTVFASQNVQGLAPPIVAPGNTQENGLRRTSSLPDRLNQTATSARPAMVSKPSGPVPMSAQPLPHLVPVPSKKAGEGEDEDEKNHLSRKTAVVLLITSTVLVALCAEFLVDSIDYIVEHTGLSQAFIGLIILPIVGNAAEHVTAVTVASKNKMDLAIGVALGSSIQIALFVTPIIVLLGWCLRTDMSLYFSLFETASLFASAFIVNYLMIDGRSNYLEGALLIAAYVIIAVAAFFYPGCGDSSDAAGSGGCS